MRTATHGKPTGRFILTQLGATALVLGVLFLIPISILYEQQVREGQTADAISTQTLLLQQISRLAESVVRGQSAGDAHRMTTLVHKARANEPRLARGLPAPVQRVVEHDLAMYTNAALLLRGDSSDAPIYREMVDLQIDLVQRLAATERQHLDRTHRQSTWVYLMLGCAVVALLMLLASGWGSLLRTSRSEAALRARVADGDGGEETVSRMEELYLIVAAAGVDPMQQIERAMRYGSRTLRYEWAAIVEWLDGEEATVSPVVSPSGAGPSARIGYALEKAIAREAYGAGAPVAFHIERLPAAFAELAGVPRAYPWRSCAAFAVPGDSKAGTPHCAVFFGSCELHSEEVGDADSQLLRLAGTLVASSSRSARHQKRLDDLAFADPLTGMPNRTHLREQLEETIVSASAAGRRFALHYIDLDGFKHVNDEDGHEVGDEVLKVAAARMGSVLRKGETLARIGGDEFVVLQSSASNVGDAREVAERLIDRLGRPFSIGGRKHRIGASIGIALFPDHGRTGTELLRHADSALYLSKRNGKGRATVYAAAAPAPIQQSDSVVA